MTILNLTRTNIAALPAIDGKWRDAGLKGFTYLQRTSKADGSLMRSFVIQYRFGNIQRTLKLGDASKLNVDQARKLAIKFFGQILDGTDPQAVREAARIEAAKLTFAEAVAQYLEQKQAEVRESSLQTMRTYLTGAAYFPTLHRKAIDSVTNADIAPHLDRISRDIGTATAGRARAILSSFYSWAWKRGLCPTNVVLATEAPKTDSGRTRTLSGDELRQVWEASGDSDYGRIIKLLMLTGCRREEIGGLRWSEIDLDRGTLTIPAERSKNKKPHTLPLSGMALAIIKAIPRRGGGEHLFGASGFVNWGNSKAALDKLVQIEAWTVHDLRRTLSTEMHELGTDPHVVEAILNHKSGHKAGVAGTYNHATYRAQIARAMTLWAEHVASIIEGRPSKVVGLKRSA